MNFNLGGTENTSGEYELFRSTTQELINLYGIYSKYIKVDRINQDFVFGEHTHISIDKDKVFEFYMLPGETDNWAGAGDLFSKFGLQNNDSIKMYIGVENMLEIHPNIVEKIGKGWDFIVGNLVVLPNNKIMEITSFEHEVEGNNNLFTYDQRKNVYSINLKSYIANHDEYSKAQDITDSDTYDYKDFGNLDSIFASEVEETEEIERRAKEVPLEDEVIYPDPIRKTPIRKTKEEENPFGVFG